MGDREQPVLNRRIHARWVRYTHAVHSANLRSIKTSLPQTPPPTFPFLQQRTKRNQVARERAKQIEHDNLILLQKMRKLMSEPQMQIDQPMTERNLHTQRRAKELMRIQSENEALLRRIQSTKPFYDVNEFEKAHIRNEYLLSRVGKYPYVSPTVPDATPPPLPNSKIRYVGSMRGSATDRPHTLPRLQTTSGSGNTNDNSRTAGSARSCSSRTPRPPSQPAPSRPTRPTANISTASSSSPSSSSSTSASSSRVLVYSTEQQLIGGRMMSLHVWEQPEQNGRVGGIIICATHKSTNVTEKGGNNGEAAEVNDDDSAATTAHPIFYPFRSLIAAYGAKKNDDGEETKESSSSSSGAIPLHYFRNPSEAAELVSRFLLPKLAWQTPSDSTSSQTLQLRLIGVEGEEMKDTHDLTPPTLSHTHTPTPTPSRMIHSRLRIRVSGIAKSPSGEMAPVAVLYALDSSSASSPQYRQVAHTHLNRPVSQSARSSDLSGCIVFEHDANADAAAPLRLGLFEVDGRTGAVRGSALIGEVKFPIHLIRWKGKEMRMRMMKNGKQLPATKAGPPTIVLTSDGEVDENDGRQRETKQTQASVLFHGPRCINGVDLVVRAYDSDDAPPSQRPATSDASQLPSALLYTLSDRSTNSSYEHSHSVPKSSIPSLLSKLHIPCDSNDSSIQAERLIELFSASRAGTSKHSHVDIQFDGRPLVSWADRAAAKSNEATEHTPPQQQATPINTPSLLASTATTSAAADSSQAPTNKDTRLDSATIRSQADKSKDNGAASALTPNNASGSATSSAAASAHVSSGAANSTPSLHAELDLDMAMPQLDDDYENDDDFVQPSEETTRDKEKKESNGDVQLKLGDSDRCETETKAEQETMPSDGTKAALPSAANTGMDENDNGTEGNDVKDIVNRAVMLDEPDAVPTVDTPSAIQDAGSSDGFIKHSADYNESRQTPQQQQQQQQQQPAPTMDDDVTVAEAEAGSAMSAESESQRSPVYSTLTNSGPVEQHAQNEAATGDAAMGALSTSELVSPSAPSAARDSKELIASPIRASSAGHTNGTGTTNDAPMSLSAVNVTEPAASNSARGAAPDHATATIPTPTATAAVTSTAASAASSSAAIGGPQTDEDREAAELARRQELRRQKKAAEKKRKEEEELKQKMEGEQAAAAAAATVTAAAAPAVTLSSTVSGSDTAAASLTLSMYVNCYSLSTPTSGIPLRPMVALYTQSDADYAFIMQTERAASEPSASSPPSSSVPSQYTFSQPLSFTSTSDASHLPIMFSIYNVPDPNAALTADDLVGQALSTQSELQQAILSGVDRVTLPIQLNGTILPNATLTLDRITQTMV